MLKMLLFTSGLMTVLYSAPASALCDISGGRVVHTQSNGSTSQYWIAAAATPPTFYYVFSTANAQHIAHLNAAYAANRQVRVQGNAAACGAAGTLRNGGGVLLVFSDSFG